MMGPKQNALVQKFVAELSGATTDIVTRERDIWRKAILLLSDVDKKATNGSIAADGCSSRFRFLADEIVNSSLQLRLHVHEMKQTLQNAASHDGDECLALLERQFSKAPWSGSPSVIAVVLSDIYEAIRSLEQEGGSTSAVKWEAPSSFERSTTKYWVTEEQLDKLVYACINEAPLLVYGRGGRLTSENDKTDFARDKLWDSFASRISSVYFDSSSMSLYKKRLAREEGAQLFRVRWYGDKPRGDDKVFLELKTHHEKWVNAASVKERVTIMEKHMTYFLARKPWFYDEAEPIVKKANPKLSGKELEAAVMLLLKMHKLIIDHDLKPCVRSVYSRAAFQSPETNSLRLTMDREILMIDETSAPVGAWCLPDDGVIDSSMVKRVPFPVFEVKLAGSEMPQAIASLLTEGVIQEAAKFSKFLTGAASFNSSKVKTLPYWAENPAFQIMMLSPVNTMKANSKAALVKSEMPKVDFQPTTLSRKTSSGLTSTEYSGSDDYQKELPSLSLKRRVARWFPFWRRTGRHNIAPKARARVEPKSYFANERTFIQWISASLWLITIAALLIEREQNGSSFLTTTGIALSAGSIVVVMYASFVYMRRIRLMQSGSSRGYVDHIGPALLAGSVLIGVIVLLVEKKSVLFAAGSASSTKAVPRVETGKCFLHANTGISALQYQPSSILVDSERHAILVSSLDSIVSHSTIDLFSDVQTLMKTPGTDVQDLVIANGRLFALAEVAEGQNSGLLELEWRNGELQLLHRWNIGKKSGSLTFMPQASGSGSLFMDTPSSVDILDLPPKISGLNSLEMMNFKFVPKGSLNKKLLQQDLSDGTISGMHAFGGILYILHGNDGVVRSWNVETGERISETPLPRGNEWEDLTIEFNTGDFLPLSGGFQSLRGAQAEQSDLIVHMVVETPPQIWSFAVDVGEKPGQLVLPECSGI